MAPLTVLSDEDVRLVLDTLTRQDLIDMHCALADALHQYSTVTEPSDSGCCAENQPKRVFIKGKDGATTLFMPASSNTGVGVKMVTLNEGNDSGKTSGLPVYDSPVSSSPRESVANLSLAESTSSGGRQGSTTSSRRQDTFSSTASTSSDSTRKESTSSVAPSSATTYTSSSSNTDYVAPILDPKTRIDLKPPDSSPRGSITLLGPTGEPRGLLNASTLTAFRTALVSNMLFKLRHTVHTITVFGAGLQAYWHAHIALMLRGEEVHHLNIINRDFNRAQRLLMVLAQHDNDDVTKAFAHKLKPSILTPEYGEYQRLLKEHVRNADVIFCCTPSVTPLFPASHLTANEGRRKARYIAAIGSFKPHMQELHEDIFRQAVQPPQQHSGSSHVHVGHRHAQEGGAVVVDTIEGAMAESGDIIKSKIGGRGVVELGELVMLKRSHWATKAEHERKELQKQYFDPKYAEKVHSGGGHGLGHLFHRKKDDHDKPDVANDDGGLRNWLQKGNVIYKSVGIGLMDVVVGMEVLRIAEERGIGTTVRNFS